MSIRWRPGDPIPKVEYTDEENRVWVEVWAALSAARQLHGAPEFLVGAEHLDLPDDRIPQLGEVCCRLDRLSGFRLRPVPGLVPMRTFYGSLADLTFMSTQYVRHPMATLDPPEPDVIHEVIGHVSLLANPVFADLHYLAGRASRQCTSQASLEFFSRVFWFTLEFGVVGQGGHVRAYGASLVSSVSELRQLGSADIRPFDIVAMGTLDRDIGRFGRVRFSVPSIDWLHRELGGFFETYSTELYEELYAPALTPSTR